MNVMNEWWNRIEWVSMQCVNMFNKLITNLIIEFVRCWIWTLQVGCEHHFFWQEVAWP